MQPILNSRNRASAIRRGAVLAIVALLVAVGTLNVSPAAAQSALIVPEGTTLDLRVETGVNTNQSSPGDEFRASVTSPLFVNGQTAIPTGSIVTGRVISVEAARTFGRPSGVTLKVDQITSPSGQSVNVIGDLSDERGTPFITVDNLPAGARVQLRINRAIRITDEFAGGGGDDQDFFNTPATISQAQIVLRDLGYYTARIDGRLTPATRAAIALFQRDQRLPQSGFLDRTTLDRLGLVSESGSEVNAVNVISADAEQRNNRLEVRIVTQGAANQQLFEEHFRRNDTVHIYVRGYRSLGYRGGTNEVRVNLDPNEWRGVNRIVVHGSGNDIVIRANEIGAGGISVTDAARIEQSVNDLLTRYAQALGVRYNRVTGQLQFTSWNYRENEVELLFALNSLASTSRLYTQLLRTTNDPQAIVGATDVYVQQANAVQRAFDRTRSGRAVGIRAGWTSLRDDFQRLDNISSRNFDNAATPR